MHLEGINSREANLEDIDIVEFKAKLRLYILMDLKQTLLIMDYLTKNFFKQYLIRALMNYDYFEAILRCLYCINNETCHVDKFDP